jgi:uncharacterized protein UPF0259
LPLDSEKAMIEDGRRAEGAMATRASGENIDIGRVIGQGFEALRGNFLPFAALALLLSGAPTFFVQYWAINEMLGVNDPDFFLTTGYWGPVLAGWLLSLVGGMVLQGMLVRSTILYLGGRQADLMQSIALALRLVVPILLVSLIVGLVTTLGLLLFVVPGVIAYCAFSVAIPALIEEQRGIFDSLRRSRDLTRGSRGRIFLLAILFWIFSIILGAVATLVTEGSAAFSLEATLPDPILSGAGAGIAAALSSLIVTVCLAALYVELRAVKEGATSDELVAIFD